MGTLRSLRPFGRRLRFEYLESRALLSVTSARPIGDVNGDGIVNTQDLALVSSNWLRQGNQPLVGDANFDGIVNSQDLAVLSSQYGRVAGSLGLGTLTPPAAVEGTTYTNFTVSHFLDTNRLAQASDYTALVQLGDGTDVTLTSTPTANGRIIADANGGFDVQISHVYPKPVTNATFAVQVDGPGGQTTRISTDAFSVANAPLTAGKLTPPVAIQNQPIKNATIFHFTDGNSFATADSFTAVVSLGDGNRVTLTSTLGQYGRIATNPRGGFDVQLSYTYASPLVDQTFGVTVTDNDGTSASASTDSFSVAHRRWWVEA